LSDGQGRPLAFLPPPGQAADCRAAEALLRHLPPDALVMAGQAYDTDAIRGQLQARGAVPNIPSKRTRRWKHRFSPVLYRDRNAIERMVGRLKGSGHRPEPPYRHALRFEALPRTLATNPLAAVQLAAAVTHWL